MESIREAGYKTRCRPIGSRSERRCFFPGLRAVPAAGRGDPLEQAR